MSIDFPGNARIDFTAGTAINNVNPSTRMCWIEFDTYAASISFLITKGGGATTGRSFRANDTNDRLELLQNFSTSSGIWQAPVNSIVAGNRYHVASTYDNSSDANDPILYINGASVAVTESSAPSGTAGSDAANTLQIGNRDNSTGFGLDGRMFDVRIYNRILTANEIATIHGCRGSDGIKHGLVFHLPMRSLAAGTAVGATSVRDVTGNGNHSTAVTGSMTYQGDFLKRRRIA